jgi:hypothetical protein
MSSISNSLVKTDRICDYVPLISTASNLVAIFEKFVVLPFIESSKKLSNRYYALIENKSLLRCLILLIPLIGNIIIGIFDFLMQNPQILALAKSHLKTTSSSHKSLPGIITKKYYNEIIPSELELIVGDVFTINLPFGCSGGLKDWEIKQLPKFLDLSHQKVDLPTRPDCQGGWKSMNNFKFKAHSSGESSILIVQDCEYDQSRLKKVEVKVKVVSN